MLEQPSETSTEKSTTAEYRVQLEGVFGSYEEAQEFFSGLYQIEKQLNELQSRVSAAILEVWQEFLNTDSLEDQDNGSNRFQKLIDLTEEIRELTKEMQQKADVFGDKAKIPDKNLQLVGPIVEILFTFSKRSTDLLSFISNAHVSMRQIKDNAAVVRVNYQRALEPADSPVEELVMNGQILIKESDKNDDKEDD